MRSSPALPPPAARWGRRWPQPSMPGPLRQVYLDVKGEQSLEQLGFAIEMMLAEPAARYLFAAVLKQSEPEQRSEDFGLHRVGRPVPHLRKHHRLRNGAKPRQFLGGLPVIGANRQ